MNILNAIDKLMEHLNSLFFLNAFILDDVLKELPIFHVLHYQE